MTLKPNVARESKFKFGSQNSKFTVFSLMNTNLNAWKHISVSETDDALRNWKIFVKALSKRLWKRRALSETHPAIKIELYTPVQDGFIHEIRIFSNLGRIHPNFKLQTSNSIVEFGRIWSLCTNSMECDLF